MGGGHWPSSAMRWLSSRPGVQDGLSRLQTYSVAMAKSETNLAAAAMRRWSPSRSLWWMPPACECKRAPNDGRDRTEFQAKQNWREMEPSQSWRGSSLA